MKIKDKKEVKKDEFRRNKKTEHPAYIYAKEGHSYKFIGITHSSITQGVRNIKLEINPNPEDKKTAYIKPKAEKEKSNNFSKPLVNWKLNKKDKPKINEVKKK